MERIGVFGGAFDPPHVGHLILAERAREEFRLDKIIFIPTNIPPHKVKPVASSLDRFELMKRAVEGNSHFEVSDIEIKRGGVSYTVDTLREIKKKNPEVQIFLLIGMDEGVDFMRWKEADDILRLSRFIIFARAGFKKEELSEFLKEKADFISLDLDITSTKIRELIGEGKSIKYLVPAKIGTCIKRKKLYLD